MASAGLLQALALGGTGGPSVVDRFNQGRQEGLKLADILSAHDARDSIAPALNNDQGALARLLYGDPETGLTVAKMLQEKDLAQKKIAAGEGTGYGLNPIWAQDGTGNWQLYQPNKSGGTPNRVNFPPGVNPQPQVNFLDTGTGYVPRATRGGQPVGNAIPKDVAGEASEKKIGEGRGAATVNLPAIEGAANTMLGTIDSLSSDPYLKNMVGPWAGKYSPNITADAHRVQSKMDQIQGQAFLQAYNTLRGGGQITEVEGQKAEAAIARLNAAQSYEDYVSALGELRDVVNGAITRARSQASQGTSPPPPNSNGNSNTNPFASDPQFGQVVNGYKIGATAKNQQTGQTIIWDGNGWRSQ